jgi:hypothetical protein
MDAGVSSTVLGVAFSMLVMTEENLLCTGDVYYVLYTALLIS